MGHPDAKIFRFLIPALLLSASGLFAQTGTGTSASITDFALPEYRKGTNTLQFILYGRKASNLGAFIQITDPVLDIVQPEWKDISKLKPMRDAKLYPFPNLAKRESGEIERKAALLRKKYSLSAEEFKFLSELLQSSGPVRDVLEKAGVAFARFSGKEIAELELLSKLYAEESGKIPEMLKKHDKASAEFWKKYPHCQVLITSESAIYDKNAKMLRGDGLTHLRSRELDVEGTGFDADYERKFVHIRKNVRVIIRPETRMKTENNSQPKQK